MAPKVLVLGSNFAGLTAALAVKHELQDDVEVTVISKDDRFIFNPSFIWIPFGKRNPADITFPVAPTFEAHGVDFVHAEATRSTPSTSRSRPPTAATASTTWWSPPAIGRTSPHPRGRPGRPGHAITSLAGRHGGRRGLAAAAGRPGAGGGGRRPGHRLLRRRL